MSDSKLVLIFLGILYYYGVPKKIVSSLDSRGKRISEVLPLPAVAPEAEEEAPPAEAAVAPAVVQDEPAAGEETPAEEEAWERYERVEYLLTPAI